MDFVIFILAIGALIFGSNIIINRSEKVATYFGISEFVIGATIIVLGTSLPEMATSVVASINFKPEMAVSNAIGSNIFNITMVLAFIFILNKNTTPNKDFFTKDSTWALVPIMLFVLMSIDGTISRFDAVLLFMLVLAYIIFLLNDSPPILENENAGQVGREGTLFWLDNISLLVFGFILIVFGSHFTVESASNIASTFKISDRIIAIILISFGTSFPELVVSIVATIKGKSDIAIGTIIASNLVNITLVIGLSAVVSKQPIPIDLTSKNMIFDIATMTVATIMLIYITANKLYSKSAGISLLVILSVFLQEIYKSIPTLNIPIFLK